MKLSRIPSILLGIFLLSCSLSCLVPPSNRSASVIADKELQLVSVLRRGKEYSKTGRMDLAEREFRLAARQRPGLDNIYNDLGFVLQSQARYQEAAQWYEKALAVEPKNTIARDNLARLLYQTEEYRPSLIENLKLIDVILSTEATELIRTVGEPYGEQDLVSIYRNLANIYYTVGVLDDAVCYSWLAHILGANTYQAGQHARMLLSIDKNAAALITLRDVFVTNQGKVPAKLVLDYGIALYLSGNATLARTAAARVLGQRDAERIDRRTAR